MGKRHDIIGIKQTIRLEWLEKTASLLLAGLDRKTIRQELHELVALHKAAGQAGDGSPETRSFIISILMKVWVTPESELVNLRDAALAKLREHSTGYLPVHWAMISAAYPFWFNVARQTGRLLNLQDQVTQQQIVQRLKEQYGDRHTISRYARYVIRSFVAWGVLKDSTGRGCYEKVVPLTVHDQDVVILLLEAALHALPEKKCALNVLFKAPSFFPFRLPILSGDFLAQRNPAMELVLYGLEEELLVLK